MPTLFLPGRNGSGMSAPRVALRTSEPYLDLECGCGWTGHDRDVEDWAVETGRDRVVRRCPGCGEAVPEWGALQPVDAAVRIARGPLRDALVEAGAYPDTDADAEA